MNNTKQKLLTATSIASRWNYHPSSVLRVMRRFGYSGLKFGERAQSARRFLEADVLAIEKILLDQRSQKPPSQDGLMAEVQ